MKVNITIWVFFDIQPWLVKLTKKGKPNQPEKKVKEICHSEFGDNGELLGLFDLVLDISQYSNIDIMGQKYLKYQESYILETLASHLEGNEKI